MVARLCVSPSWAIWFGPFRAWQCLASDNQASPQGMTLGKCMFKSSSGPSRLRTDEAVQPCPTTYTVGIMWWTSSSMRHHHARPLWSPKPKCCCRPREETIVWLSVSWKLVSRCCIPRIARDPPAEEGVSRKQGERTGPLVIGAVYLSACIQAGERLQLVVFTHWLPSPLQPHSALSTFPRYLSSTCYSPNCHFR